MPEKTSHNLKKDLTVKVVRKKPFAARFFFCFIIFGIILSSRTVSAQYRLDAFTTDNGLPQNGVRDVVQTPDGYLWFTTFDGLVRYDGAKFVVFDKNNSSGILSNRFFLLRAEADGTLLAGTEDGGLTVYQNGVFRTYTVADGLPSNKLTEFGTDTKGVFYVITHEGKSYFRDGKFIPVPESESPNNGRFYQSASGNLWFYDSDGIRQKAANGEPRFYQIPIRAYNEKLTGIKLFEDRKGYLWFGDLTGVYRLKDGEITKFTEKDGVPPGVCLLPHLEEDDGGIWFTSGMPWIAGVGLAHYKDGRFTVLGKSAGLSSIMLHKIMRDREGNIWVSTTDRGLNRVKKQFIKSLSTADGLPNTEVYPLLQTRNGDVYAGTTKGLSVYRDGRFTDALVKNDEGEIVSVTALYEEENGILWLGSADGTFYRFENGAWKKYSLGNDSVIWTIHKDKTGIVRLGTDKGLYEFRDDKLLKTYTTADGLPSNDVKIVFQDRKGTIWLGTYGGLVQIKNCSSPIAECQKQLFTTENGLASNRIRTLHEDKDETLWIGTYDGGLSRFQDGKFVNYTIENGLFNNGVFQILEDDKNDFWISCNKGIYRVSRKELEDFAAGKTAKINSIAYGKQDGMLNTEANGGRQPAGIKTADGKLWFPTQDGVAIVDPNEVSFNRQPPPVQIENVLIDRVAVDFRDGITMQANENNLEIRYTGISFIKPEQVKFRYRIEGLSSEWTDVRNIREVYFPSFPAGEFTFHIIAANSDGVWNEEGARLKITVNAPFWKKNWFIGLAALTAIFIVFTIFKLRERELQRRQSVQQEFSRKLLESQEQERKRIASEMHDSLGQYLLAIKNWAMFGLNSLTEKDAARQYLTEVSETSSLAIEEVREIAHNLRPYQLERLGLTNTLEYMLKNIKNSAAIRFVYEIEKIDGFLSKDDEIIFYRIVQESVNNLIKHSNAENARVSVKLNRDILLFTCRDDGKGFDVEAAKTSTESGLGLDGIAERVKILNGEFEIESEKEKGTTVIVRVGKK